MSFESRMVSMAQRLINLRGQTLIYTRTTQGSYDPSTGVAATTTTSQTLKVLADDYKRASDGMGFSSSLVLDGDKRITIPAASIAFTPMPGDRVQFDGFNMTVQSVKQTSAGDSAVLFELRVRT